MESEGEIKLLNVLIQAKHHVSKNLTQQIPKTELI